MMSIYEMIHIWSNISKTSASVSSGFQTLVFETPMKQEARVFEITSPTQEN